MTWIKLDDQMDEHPSIAGLSAPAFRTFIEMLLYSSRQLTDGHVPDVVAAKKWAKKPLSELQAGGVIVRAVSGWLVVGYLDHQRSREQVESERERDRKRKGNRKESAGNPPGIPRPELETESEGDPLSDHPVKPLARSAKSARRSEDTYGLNLPLDEAG